MGKINSQKLWGKSMGKIYGENLWEKLMVLINIAKLLKKTFPLAAIKEMGIKDMGIFNGTFSNNGNGKK